MTREQTTITTQEQKNHNDPKINCPRTNNHNYPKHPTLLQKNEPKSFNTHNLTNDIHAWTISNLQQSEPQLSRPENIIPPPYATEEIETTKNLQSKNINEKDGKVVYEGVYLVEAEFEIKTTISNIDYHLRWSISGDSIRFSYFLAI